MSSNSILIFLLTLTTTATASSSGSNLDNQEPPTNTIPSNETEHNNLLTLTIHADPDYVLPPNFTAFMVSDEALSHTDDTFSSKATTAATQLKHYSLFLHHIVPLRLTFADLLLLPNNTHLPTVLPDFTLLITNNSSSNFTIAGSTIIHPDFHLDDIAAIHIVAASFDYDDEFFSKVNRATNSTGGDDSQQFLGFRDFQDFLRKLLAVLIAFFVFELLAVMF